MLPYRSAAQPHMKLEASVPTSVPVCSQTIPLSLSPICSRMNSGRNAPSGTVTSVIAPTLNK